MEKILKKGFKGLFWAFLLTVAITVALDAAAVIFWKPLPRLPSLLGAGALFVLLSLLPVSARRLRGELGWLLLVLALAAALSRGVLFYFEHSGTYTANENGKRALYAGQRVLVVVPREGDELRLAAGVLEAYRHYGSELALLYTEDAGDSVVARALEVPAAQVYESRDIANAVIAFQPTLILAAREEQTLIRDALSERGNQPPVLYGLLWQEEPDFYAENLRSSLDPGWYARGGQTWDRRVRLPVEPATLSHSLLACRDFQLLRQLGLKEEGEALISGDRVFWLLDGAKADVSFVKLTNADGDFIYDYYIDPRGRESFPLCTVGGADQAYGVRVSGDRCAARITQGRVLEVSCPKGQSCIVTVTSSDGKYSDTVRISNPGRFSRETAHSVERVLRAVWEDSLPRMNTVALVGVLRDFVKAL